jgi:peptide/nickel transport system substrate-binding protein
LLSAVGVWSYFSVYTPYFEAERNRLLTFTAWLTPSDLDPALAGDTDSLTAVFNIFDRLVQYKPGSLEIEPSLASSWETPDELTYNFNLREDVLFQDSTQFNASCVKYSFERAMEMGEGTSYILDFIDTIEVLDTYKLKITLTEPLAPFLQIMAHPAASIVSPTAAGAMGTGWDELTEEPIGFNAHPVGSGPYQFDRWSLGKELVLKEHEQYFKGEPRLKTIIFEVMLESSERLLQVTKGGIDADLSSQGVTLQDFANLEKNPDVHVYKRPGTSIEFLALNLERAPLDNAKVREAISYAIDYDAIVHDAYAESVQRVSGPVAPNMFGYANLTLRLQDINKAKQLLAEAGVTEDIHLTLSYNIDNLNRRKSVEVIKNSLSRIGIDVTLEGLDFDSLIDKYTFLDYDMGLDMWVPDYFDADSYLAPLFKTGADINEFGFSDQRVDELIDKARTETSPETRQNLYAEAQQRIVDQIPAVFLFTQTHYDIVRYDIANFIQSPTSLVYVYDLYRR